MKEIQKEVAENKQRCLKLTQAVSALVRTRSAAFSPAQPPFPPRLQLANAHDHTVIPAPANACTPQNLPPEPANKYADARTIERLNRRARDQDGSIPKRRTRGLYDYEQFEKPLPKSGSRRSHMLLQACLKKK